MGRSRQVGLVAVLVAVVLLASACIYEGTWSPALPGTAPHQPAAGVVDHVDCASPTWCLSAGGSGTAGAPGAAGRWDGTSWTPAPAPPATVTDLDCAAANDCWAIADGRPRHFDGTGWTTPTVTAWPGTGAIALSCPTTTFCGVVASTGTTPVVYGWNGTTRTTLVTPPATSLADIACPVATQCSYVGAIGTGAFTGRWSSGVSVVLAPPVGYTHLSSIGCSSTTACWAANRSQSGFASWTYAGGWTSPVPPSDNLDWDHIVRCGPGVCVGIVTGWDVTFTNPSYAVIGLAGTPLPSGTFFSSFRDISCTGPSNCVYVAGAGEIWRWNGTGWHADPVALGSRHIESADDIACSPDGDCLAISPGSSDLPAIRTDGVTVDQADIGAFAAYQPDFSGSAASCPAAGWCAIASAVVEWDSYIGFDGYYVDLLTGTDGNWARERIPLYTVAVGNHPTVEVDCTSATWCLAVFGNDAGAEVRQWNGSAWTDRPDVVGPGSVVGLDCLSPTSCVLATDSDSTAGAFRRFDGTSFGPAITSPVPSGGSATLADVACLPDGSCFAAGSASTGPSSAPWVVQLLADGTVTPAPLPAAAAGPGGLTDISCTAVGDCLAVGRATVEGTERPVSLGWRGHWDLVGGALPTLADGVTDWDHVSCAGLQCTVAGTTQLTAGGTRLDVARFTWPA